MFNFIQIKNIRISTGHACTEISADRSQYKDYTTGHVYAAVITHTFDNSSGREVWTQVTAEIQSLSRDARVEAAKCTPRGLQRLYRATQAEIENDIRLLTARSYEQMLNTEQLAVGWENT